MPHGLSFQAAVDHLVATDPEFALGRAEVHGVDLPVFLNAPATLRDLQRHGLRERAIEPFLVFEDQRIDYTDWCAATNRISAALTAMGVGKGDRVAIAMKNRPEFTELYFAIPNIGAVMVALNGWWTTDELEYGFTDSGAKIVFADAARAARIAPFADRLGLTVINVDEPGAMDFPDADWPETPIDADDDFGILYSSGTTGRPKGVVLTHRGAVSAVWSWRLMARMPALMVPEGVTPPGLGPHVLFCSTPLFHVAASHALFLLSVTMGAKLVLTPKWDADQALFLMRDEGVTRFSGVPTMAADLREAAERHGVALPKLENLGAGGAKRPAPQVAEQQATFPGASIATGWGMTETNALGFNLSGPDYLAKPDHAGRLAPPIQAVKVVDGAGNPLPNGELGEILIKSAANMRCYLNRPEDTAETVRDGWLKTGDLGTLDDDGMVRILDRKKSIIIRGGENISCLEVEGAIHAHPAVLEAGVFPIPHPRLGETVGAAVHLKAGERLEGGELLDFLKGRIADFKIPARIWFSDAPLPLGTTDKLDRKAIRAMYLPE